MPVIGTNQAVNPFQKVAMANQGEVETSSAKGKVENTGDTLNRIAGNGLEEKVKFVDRRKHNQMGKDEFMKLLTYQLSNQDPSNPMDQKKLSADMAQFAQLEQLAEMNNKFENMAKNAPVENKYFAASFIGKEITTSGMTVNYDGESKNTELPFFLNRPAKNVSVNIYDKLNQLVGKVEMENVNKGAQIANWDGMYLDGARGSKGEYRIEVRAFDQQSQPFMGETKANGLVTGARFDNGEVVLTVDGKKKVYLRDVDSFKIPKSEGVNPQTLKNGIEQYQQTAKNVSYE